MDRFVVIPVNITKLPALSILVLLCTALGNHNTVAQEKYCGIYAVYAAACSLGANVDFEELVTAEFVTGHHGSTAEDLIRAVEHFRLHAYSARGLTIDSLAQLRQPVVLNVFSEEQLEVPNHWVVFLGITNGKVRIADGSEGIVEWEQAELLLRWRGVGIIVSRDSGDEKAFEILFRDWSRFGLVAILSIALISILPKRLRRLSLFGQVLVLGICTLVLIFFQNIQNEAGIFSLSNRELLKRVGDMIEPSAIPSIELCDLRLSTESFVYVDARLSADFQAGSLPGAISIPVTCTGTELEMAMRGVSTDTKLVVFCQSRQCEFDTRVARRLRRQGFESVYVLDIGWIEMQNQ